MNRNRGGLGRSEGGLSSLIPDPFTFAIGMTLASMVIAVAATPATPTEVLVAWGEGLAKLLGFIAQMSLMVLFAYALAQTDAVAHGLERLAALPRNERWARVFVCLFTGALSLIAWPLGLIMGGLMTRSVAARLRQRGIAVDRTRLGAAAFGGYVVWHMGYSASAALFVATPGHAMETQIGGTIPVTETILAPWNLATIVATLAVVATVGARLSPVLGVHDPKIDDEPPSAPAEPAAAGPAKRLHRLPTMGLGLLLVAYLMVWFAREGMRLDLDVVNWSFLAAGLLLARSPKHYADAVEAGGRAAAPVLLHYPLYAGVMGIVLETGLVTRLAEGFANIATATTLPIVAFLSGGLINFFIPSGGAQWAVQGPAFVSAAQTLGTDLPVIVMGVAYGDQWTNIIHPFIVLPFAIMSGLEVRGILAYSWRLFLAAGVPLCLGLLLAGL